MSQQKQEKFAATVTPEKLHQDKPFVQVEREPTADQFEAIAGGALSAN